MLLTVASAEHGLLCMALAALASSDELHGQPGGTSLTPPTAAPRSSRSKRSIRESLADGSFVLSPVPGVSVLKEITTLGRGGSDTTAVALAAAFGADTCEIYTDVTGVFSADPRIVPTARKLARVSFEEMLEMAAAGGRVLALRSVEFARNHNVPLHVRSSFTWELARGSPRRSQR